MHVQKLQGHRQKMIKTEQHLSKSKEDRKGRTRSENNTMAELIQTHHNCIKHKQAKGLRELRGKSAWLANLTA